MSSNSTALAQYLADNATTLQQYLTASPAALGQYLTANAAALQQFLTSNPTLLQQFLTAHPALLQTFAATLSTSAALPTLGQLLTGAQLAQFRLNVTLPGSGNEATGGLFSTFDIGSGGLFTEMLAPSQLAMLTQGLSSGVAASAYQVDVTAHGAGNTLVGGALANFTDASTGGDNAFIIEDSTLLGLAPGTTSAGSLAGSFNGNGQGDTFYFVGGAPGSSFGNVVLTEPAGTTDDTVDFSNFTGGGIDLNLNATGPQVVSAGAGLTLTLPSGRAVSNVIGSAASDTLVGGGSASNLQGAQAPDPNPDAVDAVAPSSPLTQYVYLNFNNTPTQISGLTGQLVSVSITSPGSNYTTAPTVTITGGGGSGATATAVIANGQITAINITDPGSGYTTEPIVTITGGGGSARRGLPLVSGLIGYSAADQAAVLAGLQKIYEQFEGPFGFLEFTTTAPTGFQAPNGYTTINFDSTPVFSGDPTPGGFSNEVDFGNLNQDTTVQLDVNGFMGSGSGQIAYSDSTFVNMSLTIAAHELGHTLGLQHMDAFGPIGFGISNPPGVAGYFPDYAGVVGAFLTQNDVIASPASVGSTLANAASGAAQLGARDAITLAFITDGTTVASNTTDPSNPGWTGMPTPTVAATPGTNVTLAGGGTVSAQPVNLYDLNVPNSIATGFDSGKSFTVSAVDIDGYIGDGLAFSAPDPKNPGQTLALTQSVPDYYTFTGQAGQDMNFQVMSTSITSIKDPVDTTITIFGPDGREIAFNDDQSEPSDSSIFDLVLPTTGTYTVEIGSFQTRDPSFIDPTAQNYDPAAYYNAEHGAYELFMYTFSTYNANPATDTIYGSQPSLTFTSPLPPLNSSSATATFSYGLSNEAPSSGAALYQVLLNGSPYLVAPISGTSVTLSNLPDGQNTVGIDLLAGDGTTLASTSYSWTVDTAPPTASIDSGPAQETFATSASFTFSGSDEFTPDADLVFLASLDDAGFVAVTGNSTYSNLSVGSHTLQLEVEDQDGLLSAVATYDWTVEAPGPSFTTTTLTTSDPTGVVYGQQVTFTATVNPTSGDLLTGDEVDFYDGSTLIGEGNLDGASGQYPRRLPSRCLPVSTTSRRPTTATPMTRLAPPPSPRT